MKRVVLAALAVSIVCAMQIPVAVAALSPEKIAKMKRDAPDVVKIEVLEVKQEEAAPSGRSSVEYRAKILGVTNSKSGVKVGDTITIRFDTIDHRKAKSDEDRVAAVASLIGPKQPKLLPKKWRGTVYLNSSGTKQPFGIAVFGHSFEREQ